MLLTSGRGDAVDAERSEGVAAEETNAHRDMVVEFERVNAQVLFGFVRRLGVGDAAASDVVQESLLRLFDALCAGHQIHDRKAWAFHVAYRLAMDEHRRRARGIRLVAARMHPREIDDPADDLARREVWAQVDRLPERQRAVLYLRFRADLAFEDIGTTLGITASAARSHCTQALATLRQRVTREDR